MMSATTEPLSLSATTDAAAVTPSHRRISFLDAVRGMAALAVVVQHFATARGFEPGAIVHLDLGQAGVVAFFLVSGFIIPVSMEKYGRVGPFWKARVLRLYPMYWVSLLLAVLLAALGRPVLQPVFLHHEAVAVAANLTMLQRFLGQPDAEGVYWTLALEMVFYVLCSVLLLRGWMRRPVAVTIVAALGVAAVDNLMAFALHHSPPAMHLCLVLTAFVGSVAYRVHRGETSPRILWIVLPLVFAVVAQGFWLHYVRLPDLSSPIHIDAGFWLLSWVAGYAFFFAMFALRSLQFPRWMQWLGQISYSVYLLHELLFAALPAWFGPMLQIPLATALLLVISHATYQYIERPAMKLGRSRA